VAEPAAEQPLGSRRVGGRPGPHLRSTTVRLSSPTTTLPGGRDGLVRLRAAARTGGPLHERVHPRGARRLGGEDPHVEPQGARRSVSTPSRLESGERAPVAGRGSGTAPSRVVGANGLDVTVGLRADPHVRSRRGHREISDRTLAPRSPPGAQRGTTRNDDLRGSAIRSARSTFRMGRHHVRNVMVYADVQMAFGTRAPRARRYR